MGKKQLELMEMQLQELRNIHFHMDRLEAFYMMVHNIKEDRKTGAWIEDSKGHEGGNGDKKE